MEPPRGFWSSLWNFICFLPYFVGLLVLGLIKGIILCPLICLIMGVGNSVIIFGLWPVHCFWTYYCVVSSKQLGPLLKFVICVCIPAPLILWLLVSVVGSILGGAAYGFLAPMFATFQAVGEGQTSRLYHCICDGTWDTVKGSVNVVRDFGDVCYHSYFSFMNDLRLHGPPEGKYYEIRLLYLPGALTAGLLGVFVDVPIISLTALFKSPYMLFKGWHRLFHDCIGREGPFLETICVPFAGFAILLWPLAVVGAVSASILSSILLGLYAAVVVYQESSFRFGLCFVIAALSIYDEYSNDILDMPEGSCFPRPQYQKNSPPSRSNSFATSFSRPDSFRNPPSRIGSLKSPMVDLKPLELLEGLFKECQRCGQVLVSEGVITLNDIKDSGGVISIGLPAYCLLQSLLRSAKANSAGILLSDNMTEITSTNRPKETFVDWFLNPLLIIKEDINAKNLSGAEEEYLGKLVLLSGDPVRLKNSNTGSGSLPDCDELRRAALDGLARRLKGITRSISRYPTFKRRFDSSMKNILEELVNKNSSSRSGSESQTITRTRSVFTRIFSQKSFKGRTSNHGSSHESRPVMERDVEIE